MSFNSIAGNYSVAAGSYEAGRPDYPEALIDALPLASVRSIVELGAGTGKLTRLLVPRLAGEAHVVAVEPVAEMSARLSELPRVEVVNRSASDTGLPESSAQLVICAQSFHWFDDEASVAEIARILQPGGRLALIWNMRDERLAWVEGLSRLADGYAGDAPRHQTGRWRWILQDPRFRFDREIVEEYRHPTSYEGIVARVFSISYIARLPEAEKRALMDRVETMLRENGLAADSAIEMPYVSHLYLLTRL